MWVGDMHKSVKSYTRIRQSRKKGTLATCYGESQVRSSKEDNQASRKLEIIMTDS